MKVDLFQVVHLKTTNQTREVATVKISSKKFEEDRVEKDLTDQMRILDFPIPENEKDVIFIIPSTPWAQMISVTHHLRVRLDIPFASDPYVILPITLWDRKITSEQLTYENLTGLLPKSNFVQ
jgi:hypothetical protein